MSKRISNHRSGIRRLGVATLCALMLGGCSMLPWSDDDVDSAPAGLPDYSDTADAVPKHERIRKASLRTYTVLGRTYHPLKSSKGFTERGIASWYGKKFHGRKTAIGDTYDMYGMTAAHKHLPLPTYVRVRNIENGKSAVVRVNDRGPFHGNRIIDLSYAAASKLGVIRKGTAMVEIEAINPDRPDETRLGRNPAPVDNGRNTLFVQVGAFRSRLNANRYKRQMEQLLEQQNIQVTPPGQGLHKVRIGPLQSVEAADAVIQQLEAAEIYESQLLIL